MTSNYNNNIPQPSDRLFESQPQLLNNYAQLDTTMGVDHYDFSDNTTANGKHKTVTHLDQTSHPATAATEVKSYAVDTGTLGLMSWSRSPDSAGTGGGVTGISALHSDDAVTVANSATINLLDLTSLNDCCGEIYAWAKGTTTTPGFRYSSYVFFWDSTATDPASRLQVKSFATVVTTVPPAVPIEISTDGANVITLTNNNGSSLDIYWTLKINRYIV